MIQGEGWGSNSGLANFGVSCTMLQRVDVLSRPERHKGHMAVNQRSALFRARQFDDAESAPAARDAAARYIQRSVIVRQADAA